jgi:iron complex transport system substrate-binding protein
MKTIVVSACAACVVLAQPVLTQTRFTDDARRSVDVPGRVTRVFAAGAPADVLLYTLVPEMLVGRNRLPEGDALEFIPPAYRRPVLIRQLPEVDNPAADADLLALKPDMYVDYGTVDKDYIAAVEAVQRRTGVAGVILDSELRRIPETYRRLGVAFGVASRGERLGAAADRILVKYRGMLATVQPRVYLACSADGFAPCLADERSGEQLAWLGGVNVAGTRASAPRRPLTIDEVRAMRPQVIIVSGGAGAATRLKANSAWKDVEAAAAGRVYEWPSLPINWGARPPSVNRLAGLMWLAYVAAGRPFDSALHSDIRDFFRDFYHLELTEAQLQKVLRS